MVDSRINRYYDPSTDQFLSVDPDVATTEQPYAFTNDDPLNAEDPSAMIAPSSTPPPKLLSFTSILKLSPPRRRR
jgi:hypothetical protein